MASTINALTSGGGGLTMVGDATGNLNIQSGGSTVVAVTSAGATVTGTLAATGAVSGTTGTFTSTLGVTGAITGSSTVAGSTGILYPLTSGTAVASTSGTSIDFTSIPSWVKRITVMFNGVSTNSTSIKQVQIGAGSITTTGYISTGVNLSTVSVVTSLTSGFVLYSNNASDTISGVMVLTLVSGNIWVSSHSSKIATNIAITGGGDITLSGVLDRIRLTTVNGTDTFDAGSVNILYE